MRQIEDKNHPFRILARTRKSGANKIGQKQKVTCLNFANFCHNKVGKKIKKKYLFCIGRIEIEK